MINQIKEFVVCLHDSEYLSIDENKSILKIYDFLLNHIFVEPNTPTEYFYFGWYYETIKKEYEQMKNII